MNETQAKSLSEFVVLQSGGTPSKTATDNWGGTTPWISAKDLKSFRLLDSEDHLTQKGEKEATRLVKPKTVLILVRGMTLHRDIPICVTEKTSAFNQDIKAVVPKNGLLNEYLPYLLLGHKETLLTYVDSAGHGTGRLNTNTLSKLPILLPTESEQKAIAHLLGTLDDKIELLRQTNETLETMARALFKSWFVDFDPVRKKAEGQATGLPKEIEDLFPNEFEDSELGEIPKGWKVEVLSSEAELVYGKALKAEDRNPGSVAVYGSNGVVGFHDQALKNGKGVVVGRKGNPGLVRWASSDFFVIDTAFYVEPRDSLSLEYLFYALEALDIPRLASDSAVPGVSRESIYRCLILKPLLRAVQCFTTWVSQFKAQVSQNESEVGNLESIRDSLLPQLIAGDLELTDEMISQILEPAK